MMGAAHTLHALALLVVVGAAHCSALALVPSAVATCRTWQVTNADTHNGTYNMAFSEDGTYPCAITLCELVVAAQQLCVLMWRCGCACRRHDGNCHRELLCAGL